MRKKGEIWQTYGEITQTNKKSETPKTLYRGVRNGEWKMQCLTYMGKHIKVI
jgi:hypothetical protein